MHSFPSFPLITCIHFVKKGHNSLRTGVQVKIYLVVFLRGEVTKTQRFLSDALSVLQALQTGKDTDLNNLMSNITRLCMKHTVILQWIPSHCGIHGNETADTLAKEGTTYAQNDRSTTYSEVKTIIKAKQQNLL